jgi:hypothetical protein
MARNSEEKIQDSERDLSATKESKELLCLE